MENGNPYAMLFFGVWIFLMLVSFLIFHRGSNVGLKRRLWPVFMLIGGSVFLLFAWLMKAPTHMLTFMVPVVALITIAKIFTVKFCDGCGKIATNRNPFSPARVCPHCNRALDR